VHKIESLQAMIGEQGIQLIDKGAIAHVRSYKRIDPLWLESARAHVRTVKLDVGRPE
jgi:hypothetical protein